METKIITKEFSSDIRLKNEPFPLFGRMIPSCENGIWSYREQLFAPEDIQQDCFPDENYDFDKMSGEYTFVGAYEGEKCIGLAIMKDAWYRYMYLYDLKVCSAYRKQGVGAVLIEKSLEIAHQRNYNGIYTIAQDNNLAACRFYLKQGFEIGGFNNRVYRGTSQEGNADILLYLDK